MCTPFKFSAARRLLSLFMSCKTTSLLAAYLDDSKDVAGVLELIRDKYPKSLSTYITQVKKEWLTLNKTSASYAGEFLAMTNKVRAWKAKASASEAKTLETALQKLQTFDAMNMQDKYNIQRSLRSHNFTGHAATDDLLSHVQILPQFVADLKIDMAERVAIQQKAAESLVNKSSDAMTVQASKLLARVHSILESKKSNTFDLACALSVVTGRRMVEIFKTGTFTAIADQPYATIFDGQAKKQFKIDGFKIPLLCTFDLLDAALNRLRITKNTDDLNNSEVNLRYSSSCNAGARRMFGSTRTFHCCRSVYGVLSFHAAMPHTLSLNLWLSKILGHASLTNSLNYSSIHITDLEDKDKHSFSFE